MYKAELDAQGQTYNGEGKTILEAINNLPLTYSDITYKGTLRVSEGTKQFEKFFMLRPLRRFFANKLVRSQYANQIERLLQ